MFLILYSSKISQCARRAKGIATTPPFIAYEHIR